MGKKREKIFFSTFFILLKRNTNDVPYAKFHSDSSKNQDRSPKCIKLVKVTIELLGPFTRTTRTFYQYNLNLLLELLGLFTRTNRTFYQNHSDLLLEPLGPLLELLGPFTRITRTFYQNYSNILLELLENVTRTTLIF